MRWRWLPILAPALMGLILGFIFQQLDFPNPVIYLRADITALITLLGIFLSGVAAVLLLLFDWTERQRLNTSLEAAEERRRFLQRLDHELKNPLTAILAGLANLSAAENAEKRQDSLESVEAQVDRLRRLVGELRKLSDLETRPLELAPVEIGDLLEEVFALAHDKPEAASRQLSLSIPRAPWPLPTISGDWDLLFLAIHNLLDNALKFTGEGGRIEVRATEDDDSVVIEIADTGPGIPEPEVPHVWDELYRGEGARGVPGSGLGLALVRSIITRHKGQVSLRSRSGQGSLFTVSLPLKQISRR